MQNILQASQHPDAQTLDYCCASIAVHAANRTMGFVTSSNMIGKCEAMEN